jgi:hypothetical protein
MMKTEINYVVLPPGPETIHFQRQAFDSRLGKGTDPHRYETREQRSPRIGRSKEFRRSEGAEGFHNMVKAQVALKGHPHREEILKLLRTDIR